MNYDSLFYLKYHATTASSTYLHTLSLHATLPIYTSVFARTSCHSLRTNPPSGEYNFTEIFPTPFLYGAAPGCPLFFSWPTTSTTTLPRRSISNCLSDEHTSVIQSLMLTSSAVFCLTHNTHDPSLLPPTAC